MKRITALAIAIGLVILLASPAMALSLGVSPPQVEFDVPASGATEVNLSVYHFTGDVAIELEDIPLRVEPKVVTVEDVEGGTPVTLTFYGDKSLGLQTFKGKIYFRAMTGGNVALRMAVKATVNHIVTGVTTEVVAPGITSTDISSVIDKAGVISENIVKVVSEDGKAKLEIPQGAKALTAEGEALQEIKVEELSKVPATPQFSIIGPAYNFGPDGATFEPAMKLSLNYCTACCKKAGVAEEDLVIAYYDANQDWVELETDVDTINHVVTAQVSHFTQFAVLAPKAAPEPPEASAEAEGFPIIPIAAIAAGAAIVITLIVVLTRRRRY